MVVGVAASESSRRAIERSLQTVRSAAGTHGTNEIKLNEMSETQYFAFLNRIAKAGAVLFATATDASLNIPEVVLEHQRIQVAKIRANIPRMKYEGGRRGIAMLADQLEALSPQLYVQLICQVNLLHDIIARGITYFVQRVPSTLREFRWRIDQKNASRTKYEEAFEKIAPPLLQSRSFREPLVRVRGFDYSYFSAYEFADDKLPDYLATEYGMQIEDGINVQALFRGNLKFQDSRSSVGIQVADLLASGLRRCLRGQFQDNESMAAALGQLMVQNAHNKPPIDLISLSQPAFASGKVARLVRIMARSSRAMLTRKRVANGDT